MKSSSNFTGLEIAIIGMSGRFPGAKNPYEFWNNIKNGVESVLFIAEEELLAAGVDKALLENPNYVRSDVRVEGKEYFDSSFFGYLPAESMIMDPQMRMFHECVWEALEDAGYNPDAYEEMIGIYAGAGLNTNWDIYGMVVGVGTSVDSFTGQQLRRGDFMASRVSYKLNLKGPAVYVQTACSTSLVAVHIACRGLLMGECQIALAGGVTLSPFPLPGYLYQEGMVQSPDGHCHAFDAEAKGTVTGEGAAVVVLKQLNEAIADRDNIMAVIKGSAINNDGLRKVGYTAPSVDGQAEVLRMAYKMARVEPQSITYIEAHGTGTELGDPIEVEALTQVFGKSKEKYCALGSVKTNIGHLDTAAGTAGLTKVVLSLIHRQIPPSLNFITPNPRIDFENSPFYVNTELKEWENHKYPLRAGVSSFGIGGTNAHVVLEEAPPLEPSSQSRGYQLLLFSAKTVSVLDRMTEDFRTFLTENEENEDIKLADAAYTLQLGRQPFIHRSALVCRDMQEATDILDTGGADRLMRFTIGKERPSIVFMFSGQGSQYVNMGLDLYQTEPIFRSEVDRCFEILKSIGSHEMKGVLYPDMHEEDKGMAEAAEEKLNQFTYLSPIKFIFDYSLAVLLMKWGIQPNAMIGHSFGEYTAACLAGVFSLEDALYLSAARGELLEQMSEGAMLSVPLSKEELTSLLTDELSLAAVNADSLCVVSGPVEAVDRFEAQLNEKGNECLRFNVSRAGHSWMMKEITEEFRQKLKKVKFNKPQIPYISGLTGTWITGEEAVDPGYWTRHLSKTIRFADGLTTLLKEPNPVFLQVGPDRGLPLFVNRHPDKKPGALVLNLVRHHKEKVSDIYHLLAQIGQMWLHGVTIDWKLFYAGEKRRRISLPTYPFEKIKYPVKADIEKLAAKIGTGRVSTDDLYTYPQTQMQMDDWELQQRQEARVERPSLSTEYREPSTPTEYTLVEIWQKFFSIGKIGIDDDFYELGGDSLKGMSLCNIIHKGLNVRVPLAEFFAVSTIGELAAYIDVSQKETFAVIKNAEEKEYYMLSSAQKRLHFIHQMIPNNTAYNIPLVVPLKERMDREQLGRIFRQIIHRHESFRTSFEMIEEEPVQRIHKDVEFEIEYISVERRAESVGQREQEEELYASFIKNFIRPFDLSKAPLLRTGLVKTGKSRHLLMVDMHHIIADGFSLNIVEKEFMALASGEQLPGITLQYKDFTEWQNSEEQERATKKQESYWLQTYEGEPPPLNLPTDFPRPLIHSFAGSTVEFRLGKEKTGSIKQMAKKFDSTLFMVLLAAHNILLYKLSGQEDIVVGVPIAGRRHGDLQNIIGMFVNTLPIRNYPSPEKRFIDFLQEVKQTTTAAYENQDYQFEDLVEKLKVNRDTSRNPVFDVAFNSPSVTEFHGENFEFESDDNQAYVHRPGTSRFDITFTYVESAAGLFFSIEYCSELFKPATIEQFIGYFRTILSCLLNNPLLRLKETDILSEEEKNRQLIEFNQTTADYPEDKTIHELFEEQASRRPDSVAVVGAERRADSAAQIVGAQGTVPLPGDHVSITYNELNEKSNHLVHLLYEKGVQPETNPIVGIMMERSIEFIIGIMGILKVGGIYLPIDPDYPGERIDFMLKDSNAALLLTAPELLDVCRGTTGGAAHPAHKGASTNLAYIIYTSGTTGRPKGTPVEHRALVNLCNWHNNYYGVTEKDNATQYANVGFDASVWEIFPYLIKGGTLHIIGEDIKLDIQRLGDYYQKHHITISFLPTQLCQQFMEEAGEIPSLQCLLTGGDKLNRFVETGCRLYNNYGPTENTVVTTSCLVETYSENIPIGKPIDNSRVYILNKDNLQLQPPGVAGELCIAGDSLARGYLNRPELTAEKFRRTVISHSSFVISSSCSSPKTNDQCLMTNDRLYRTGDLARWLSDGNIEFIGRVDQQVKIRGYRIEPGEIEAQLFAIEGIKEAVAIDRETKAGEKYLCGYIVSETDVEIDAKKIKSILSGMLPAYMIPEYFVQIDKIPLTSNGKLDRKRLPQPEFARGAYVAPESEIERKLVEIWSEILGSEKEVIGIDANFFEIGGNSLNLIKMNTRIKEFYGRDIPITTMFRLATIRELAAFVQKEEINFYVSDELLDKSAEVRHETLSSGRTAIGETTGDSSLTGIEIAIIGMAGRFPGAKNLNEFWDNLKNGIESVSFFSDKELLSAGMDKDLLENPDFVKGSIRLEGKEYFDSSFFGYLPVEVMIMNPQIRMFHECVWEALEDAGYDPDNYEGLIGLYAGASLDVNWEIYSMMSETGMAVDSFTSQQLRRGDFIASRVSYKLNLEGPAIFIQTACSTSLVALHLACRSLLMGESHIALAGGISLFFAPSPGYPYQEGMPFSPDGHCRAFDANAKGTMSGEGAAVVVLKRLKDAIADRDNIMAVIKGSDVNNDGLHKVGYSAPSVDGQIKVIRKAHKMAQVEPQSITYIEAHGTGTQLGDPIEVEALTQVFGKSKEKYCALGSLKTNIGHLDTAAGTAGLTKVVLSLIHRQIPPSLHFKTPNPRIDFENSPFYVNTELREWENHKYPLRAGVSSFGIGGTNAHVVLEEAPPLEPSSESREYQLLLFSAKAVSVLDRMRENFRTFFEENEENKDIKLADAAYTLQVGRQPFIHRSALVCRDMQEAVEILDTGGADRLMRFTIGKERPSIVFMFSGQGSQYVNMGLDLYQTEPIFRSEVDRCFEILKSIGNHEIKGILYPDTDEEDKGIVEIAEEKLNQFTYLSPIKFIFDYSLAVLLMKCGIQPDAMIGHSFGEYTAACLAGVFSLEDALYLSAARGELLEQMSEGAMLSVPLSKEELTSLLTDELSLAAVNADSLCVVSGPVEAIDRFEAQLNEKGYECLRYNVSRAGHSWMMKEITGEFRQKLEKVKFNKPQIPYISGLTGTWITGEEAVDPGYWTRHLGKTIRFADGLTTLLKEPNPVFLQVGPDRGLPLFVNRHPDKKPGPLVLNLVRHPKEEVSDVYHLLQQIGQMWLHGVTIDWEVFYANEKRHRISLPAYPFEKIKYPVTADIGKLVSKIGTGRVSTDDLYTYPQTQMQMDDWELQQRQEARVERPSLSTGYREPSTPTEYALVEIWGKFFNIGKIGIDDDFYELGGDSLKGMNLCNIIHKGLNVRVPLAEFFAVSTIGELAAYIDASQKEKFAIIEKAEEKEYYMLSSAQKRLYFIQQMIPNNTAYNIPLVVPFKENLDGEQLDRIFRQIIHRHESFRTSFEMIEEEPVQRIHKGVEFEIEYISVERRAESVGQREQEEELYASFIKNFIRPFDLSKAPLLRAGLVKTGKSQLLLMVDMHHIIADGSSLDIVEKEFTILASGKQLPGLTLQYRDYTEWLNNEKQKRAIKKQEEYWLKTFAGELPTLHLPVDYPRPSVQSVEGSIVNFDMSKEKTNLIKKMAKAFDTTFFIMLLAAYNILISRLSSQEDIVVGVPIAGRRHSDLQHTIGMFVNTLPIRNYPSMEKRFTDFLQEVKQTTTAAYENQDYPFEDLVEKLEVNRDTSRNPVFDVAFNLVSQLQFSGELPESESDQDYDHQPVTSRFDLTFTFIEVGGGLSFSIEYCTKLFKPATIERFIGYFKKIVSCLLENPDVKLAEIDILGEDEKQRLLIEFNQTTADYPEDKTIHELFEEQASRRPDSAAVVSVERRADSAAQIVGAQGTVPLPGDHVSITYNELNEKSNHLAHLLYEKGVQPETNPIVGIMMERSIEFIIGMMGILKAGGTYLPIDPDYPGERIDFMLKDSNAALLLTAPELLDICRGTAWGAAHPAHKGASTNLAYIIYTSGTTGRPKGTPVEHRALVNLCNWHNNYYGVTEKDNATQYANVAFDASVWEIFPYLIKGGTLHIIGEDIKLDIRRLAAYYVKHHITISFLPTQLCQHFIEEAGEIPSLRCLLTGGDRLNRFVETGCRLYNNYGPTENTVVTTSCLVEAHKENIPIGKPINNSRVYILNKDNLQLQPPGVAGELCIAGDSLARGYLNRPELTTEKFIIHHSSLIIYRLYRTGDLARWLWDGDIEFLGRIDHQVKIRGFRIETGEIENQILEMEEINEAVVIPRELEDGERYMCAYIVTGKEIDLFDLRQHLSTRLPNYMIPSYFISIEKIPLTSNGKVDHKRLPIPELVPGSDYVGPRDEIEERMVDMWSEVLGIKKGEINVTADFFELGGHSLKATTLAARIHKVFNTDVPLEMIFKRPTIRGLSEYISGAAKAPLISIQPVEKREYYELSSAQKRLFAIQQMETDSVGYNVPLPMVLEGELSGEYLEGIIGKLIKRHESLRTSFVMIGRKPMQLIHEDAEFKTEYYDLATKSTKEEKNRGKGPIHHFVRAFDLSKAPLLRVGLFQWEKHEHVLILDMHHIITDGSSLPVLSKELMDLYAGKELKPLRIQYKDYAQWQKDQKEKQKKQEEYWLDVFKADVPVLDLPTDYPRPAVQSFEGHQIIFTPDKADTKQLRELAAAYGVTLYMALLSIFNVLLAKLSGQEDIVVGAPIAGRRHAELEPIIGMFVNTLALRNLPTPEKTFDDFLKEVKERTLGAFENQEYQFEDLVEQVPVNRDMSRNPLFDVMFVLQNVEHPGLEIPGLKLRPYEYEMTISKFDLTLTGMEKGKNLFFLLEYCTKLFKKETIERFMSYFNNVLSEIVKYPGKKLADIEIISAVEKNRILYDFNNTEVEYPEDKTIHELFEEQAARTPDFVSVVGKGTGYTDARIHGNISITFRELNEKSNRLAHLLREKGVEPDNVVGIMVERSLEMIIGILGILKAGGAYLPIAPGNPQKRIDYMLSDSNARVLVSELSEVSKVSEGTEVVKLNELREEYPTHLTHLTHPTHLCYVIYTSGTTGRPKGTLTTHYNVIRVVRNTNYIDITEQDRILQLSNYAFDGSVFDIFGALLNGAVLVMISAEDLLAVDKLGEIIKKEDITLFFVTTALFNALVDIDVDCFDRVRKVLFGGEKVSVEHSGKALEYLGKDRIVNVYGPTETTVYASYYPIDAIEENAGTIPIGKPISNTSVFILDKHLNPVPIMAYGEIYIGGEGVARGYLNRPELTVERFVDYRSYMSYRTYFSKKLYKTGDLGRWLPDGNIEFIGRIDQQVKIRGFRVELGEIENRLSLIEGINEAVVVDRRDQNGRKYLCAYIVSSSDVDTDKIKSILARTLPAYMIPDFYMKIARIPLTSNGKTDRKKLPQLELSAGERYVAPANETEEKLVEIWSEVLGFKKEAISVDSNFFDMGGHSLSLVNMKAKIKEVFARDIPIATLFRLSTIGLLAKYIQEDRINLQVSEEELDEGVDTMDETLSILVEDGDE